jgi:hypothetical protein
MASHAGGGKAILCESISIMLMTDPSPKTLSKIDPEFMIATIAGVGLQAL